MAKGHLACIGSKEIYGTLEICYIETSSHQETPSPCHSQRTCCHLWAFFLVRGVGNT